MKIENNIPQVARPQTDALGAVDNKSKPRAAQGSAVAAKDRATLSEEAQFLSKMMSAAKESSETSPAREARIQAIQSQVESGQYSIPYDALARTMVRKLNLG
jgi:flagellar biosynthesis anti-sigma factor FlgM